MKKFKLENEPKLESGFIVPDHYFDTFSKKVFTQLADNEIKVIPLYKRKKSIFIAVAAVLVIGLLIPIYNQLSRNSEELDTTTLENHLTYQTDINPYELISELDEEDLTKMESAIQLKDESIEDILTTNSDLERLITE